MAIPLALDRCMRQRLIQPLSHASRNTDEKRATLRPGEGCTDLPMPAKNPGCECPLLALSGHHSPTDPCPLLGVKRTLLLVLDVPRRSSKRCLLAMNWRSRRD